MSQFRNICVIVDLQEYDRHGRSVVFLKKNIIRKENKMKKSVLMILSLVMVTVIALTGTVAYLSSTDEDVNVMTMGNVKIEQIEQ